MTMTVPSPADFFNRDADIERHQGRPLILPAGSPEGARPVPYTRASALSDYISDHRHIHRWEMRYLARSMGQNPDLAELAAVETYSTGFDAPQRQEKSASGRRLDAIIERALDRAGIDQKADRGTAVHAATEPGNGQPVPSTIRDDVESFKRTLEECGAEILATEVFVANDEVQAAGTFDHLVRFPGLGVVILDKKTGNANPWEFGVQFSVYARADVYHVETHERIPLSAFVDNYEDVRDDVAIAAMIKGGKTRLIEIDIEKGWAGAKAAAAARDYNGDNGLSSDCTQARLKAARKARDVLAETIAATVQPGTLEDLWRQHKALWTPELTALAADRKRLLTGAA